MVAEDGFLEYAAVHGHHYGTPRQPVMEALANGQNVMLDIDPQGALQVMERMPGCVSVFYPAPLVCRAAPSPGGPAHRAAGGNRAPAAQRARRGGADESLSVLADRNDDVDAAYETLKDIVSAEKQRSVRYFPEMED